jgi:RimJ/RimL family protein N-acetyltransferase
MNRKPLRLETDRLIVRRFEARDVADILAYSRYEQDDRFLKRNVDWELTEESVLQWWAPMMTMKPEEAIHWLSLVIELKSERRVIGNVGFNAKRTGEMFHGMIGWTLGKAHQGNGYATEAAGALLDYLFRTVGFHRVHALTSPKNAKSWHLMDRLGMRREAHFRQNCFVDGSWDDEFAYAILAEEWAERHAQPPGQRTRDGAAAPLHRDEL